MGEPQQVKNELYRLSVGNKVQGRRPVAVGGEASYRIWLNVCDLQDVWS